MARRKSTASTAIHQETHPKTVPVALELDETLILSLARGILETRLKPPGDALNDRSKIEQFLLHELGDQERELFGCLFLDAHYRLIRYETLFLGTLDRNTVYLREIVKAALAANSRFVIAVHNHPQGKPTPSPLDIATTEKIKAALRFVDITLIDHLIVASNQVIAIPI